MTGKIAIHLRASVVIGCVLALPTLTPNPAAWAVPNITSVSGPLTHQSSATISGSGFGTKSPAAPLLWADFENGTIDPGPLGLMTNWSVNQNLTLTTSNQRPHSTYSAMGQWGVLFVPGTQSFSFRLDRGSPYYTTVYMYLKRYYNFSQTANQKFWRIFASAGCDFVASTSNGGIALNGCDPQIYDRFQVVALYPNRWNIHEFIWRQTGGTGLKKDGTPSNGTGVWDFTQNGVRLQHLEGVDNGTNNYDQLRVADNFTDSNNLPPAGAQVYMDDIYIDTVLSRVMIGNAPTFATSTQREIQIPTEWSDASVTVTVNLGSFTSSANAYLYVIDANGQVNAKGFRLCASPCPGSPAAPTNLQLQ